jgi:hypothetical protein
MGRLTQMRDGRAIGRRRRAVTMCEFPPVASEPQGQFRPAPGTVMKRDRNLVAELRCAYRTTAGDADFRARSEMSKRGGDHHLRRADLCGLSENRKHSGSPRALQDRGTRQP